MIASGGFGGLGQGRVGKEVSGFDRAVNSREFLIHHAACADIQMAYFGVAHLPLGQADFGFRGVDQRMRMIAPELVPIGFFGLEDGVVGPIGAATKAIQNNE